MTPDAAVLIGSRIDNGVAAPALWDAEHGIRLLHDVLASEHGFAQEDLDFRTISGISADQRTLLVRSGAGQLSELRVIYLDQPLVTSVPEPASLLAIAVVATVAALRRRGSP
jgi:hypothetical protein